MERAWPICNEDKREDTLTDEDIMFKYQYDGCWEQPSDESGVSITSSEIRRSPYLEEATEPWWTTLKRKAFQGWREWCKQERKGKGKVKGVGKGKHLDRDPGAASSSTTGEAQGSRCRGGMEIVTGGDDIRWPKKRRLRDLGGKGDCGWRAVAYAHAVRSKPPKENNYLDRQVEDLKEAALEELKKDEEWKKAWAPDVESDADWTQYDDGEPPRSAEEVLERIQEKGDGLDGWSCTAWPWPRRPILLCLPQPKEEDGANLGSQRK